MMEDIKKSHDVDAVGGSGDHPAVKRRHRMRCVVANEHVASFYADVRTAVRERGCQHAIAGPDVENVGIARDEPCGVLRKDAHPPRIRNDAVNTIQKGHRRRSPRMLIKKLPRIVWSPSAVKLPPGIAHRKARR